MSLLSPCGRRELAVYLSLRGHSQNTLLVSLLHSRKASSSSQVQSGRPHFQPTHSSQRRRSRAPGSGLGPLTRSSRSRLMAGDRALNIYTFSFAYLTLPNGGSSVYGRHAVRVQTAGLLTGSGAERPVEDLRVWLLPLSERTPLCVGPGPEK